MKKKFSKNRDDKLIRTDEIASEYRDLIKHENELINHRLRWLLTIQGLLFATTGLAFRYSGEVLSVEAFITLIAVIGVLASTSSFSALESADFAIRKLVEEFKEKFPRYDGAPIIGLNFSEWNMNRNNWEIRVLKLMRPAVFLPRLFSYAWVVLFLAIWGKKILNF